MIIGNGLIASAFAPYFLDDQDVLVFASGVSNSGETRRDEFLREKRALRECVSHGKFIIYFSTCSVKDPELVNTPYVVHKNEMETMVRAAKEYAVFRLPQVVGKTSNPNTLTNYLYRKIVSGSGFKVWRYARRNLIDVDDVASIGSYMVRTGLANGNTTNIASPFSISIPQLVNVFELVLGRKADYELIDAGGAYSIDSASANDAAKRADVNFDESYIERVIRKYYGES